MGGNGNFQDIHLSSVTFMSEWPEIEAPAM